MVSRLEKHGDGQALALDKTLLEMLRIDADTPLYVEVIHGSLIVTPINAETARIEATKPLDFQQTVPDVVPYPALLMREYHALVDKKLRRTITPDEQTRLQEARNQIAAIDAQRSRPDTWDIQAQTLRQELAELRAEVEALPDAIPTLK